MNFIRSLNRGIFYFFKPEFSNLVANFRYESHENIQNFKPNIPKIMHAESPKPWAMGREYYYNSD